MTIVDTRTSEVVTATGGSARSQLDDLDERSWKPRPFAGFTIAAIAFIVPFAAAIVAVQIAARFAARPSTLVPLLAWLVAMAAIATTTLWTVDKQARRLLPLAMMLRLSLVFPDHAPSRFAAALRSGSGKALERAVDRATTEEEFATSQATAEIVLDLVAALSAHDRLTRGHCERVRAYSDLIGRQLGLDAEGASKLHWAALLHDVGKLDVPPEILNKKGRLNDEEWKIVRGHPAASDRWLVHVEPWLGEWALAASQHHERYDGDGYPNGLRGNEISLAGRIVAVADAFDVMTAARSYKKPFPAAQARTELANNAGTQFDPAVVRAFLAISLGRLRLVMGPLAWLAGVVPGFITLGGAASGAGTVVTAAAVTASGFVAPKVPEPAPPAPPPIVGTAPATTSPGAALPAAAHPNPALGANVSVVPDAPGADPSPTTPTSIATRAPGRSRGDTPTTKPDSTPETTPDTRPDGTGVDAHPAPTTLPNTPTTVDVPGAGTPPATVAPAPSNAPVANDDLVGPVLLGTRVRVDVLANDTDADGDLDENTLKIVQYPPANQYAQIGISSHEIDIRPNTLFTGTMSLIYEVCDADGNCSTATLTVAFLLSL
jgi:HD superfamily phosphodiesterase